MTFTSAKVTAADITAAATIATTHRILVVRTVNQAASFSAGSCFGASGSVASTAASANTSSSSFSASCALCSRPRMPSKGLGWSNRLGLPQGSISAAKASASLADALGFVIASSCWRR